MDSASTYFAFGLRIRSELVLPELSGTADGGLPADVVIRLGAVEPTLNGGRQLEQSVHVAPNEVLLDFPETRLLVRSGREIIVQPAAGASDRDVRLYLLGSGMGAIFHQRRLLPLHANAIEFDGRAVAFTGPSGAGKSTLAAHFHRIGRRVLCDDVCVVSFNDAGAAMAWPGISRIKLWGDALAALGRDAGDLDPVATDTAKYSLPMPTDRAQHPLPLACIYVLGTAPNGTPAGIRRLSGVEAVDTLLANVYRWEFTMDLGVSEVQFSNVVATLRDCPVFAVGRAWGFEVFEEEASKVERHFAGEVDDHHRAHASGQELD